MNVKDAKGNSDNELMQDIREDCEPWIQQNCPIRLDTYPNVHLHLQAMLLAWTKKEEE